MPVTRLNKVSGYDDRISGKYRTARQRELYTGLIESSTSWFIRCDHRGACGSQHGYPDPAVGYWPESRLGHVCVSPEPVGSTHLRFGDARVVEIYAYGIK